MRPILPLVAACLWIAPAASAQVQQAGASLIRDADRFRSAEWQVTTLVRLDSSKTTDSMAIRRIGEIERLGPRRYLYAGETTNKKKWALFLWDNGTTTQLAVDDREFMVDTRKAKFWLSPSVGTVDGRVIATLSVGQRAPNALWIHDGAAWKPLIQKGDSIRVDGRTLVVDGFYGGGQDSSGRMLLNVQSKTPKFNGIVRLSANGAEKVVEEGDSLPGVPSLKILGLAIFGLNSGLRSLEPTRDGWVAVVRNDLGARRYQDLVIARSPAGTRVLAQSDSFGVRDADSIGTKVFMSPAGAAALQRGRSVGIVSPSGAWQPLIGPDDLGHKDGHELSDVVWLDSSGTRALLAVTLAKVSVSNSTSGVTVTRLLSLYPQLFHYDGTRATKVQPDSSFGSTIFVSARLGSIVHHVPGYGDPVVAIFADSAFVFDGASRAFVRAPTFRTAEGDIPLVGVRAWESPNEALVWHGGRLMLLQRPR